MKLGLLFAGQGSQHPGMGADFYENCENFRKIFDLLTDEQKEIAFNGPAEKINDTRNIRSHLKTIARIQKRTRRKIIKQFCHKILTFVKKMMQCRGICSQKTTNKIALLFPRFWGNKSGRTRKTRRNEWKQNSSNG